MTPKERTKDLYLRRTYGITLAEYLQKLQDQRESCAICEKHKSAFKHALHVDHNHKTGKVRGLLCYRCNKFLVGRHTAKTVALLQKYFDTYDPDEVAA